MKYIRHFNSQEDYEEFIKSLSADQTVLAGGSGKVYIQVATPTPPPIDYSKVAVFFENVGTDDAVISIQKNNKSANTASLEISTDNKNWETWGETSIDALSKTIGAGERLYIRNAKDVGYFNNSSLYNYFSSTGANIIVGGNIMSLGYNDFVDKTSIIQNYGYGRLFQSMSRLVDASRLILPATTLKKCCYSYMFYQCAALTTAPELPATTLIDYCYEHMFRGCSALTTAPKLPAETLASYCYTYMFKDCTSLTTAPELSATTLANYCYNYMFNGCSNLTTAPELPAETLADGCYYSMFGGCKSLTTAPTLPATTLATNCYNSMFLSCSKLNYIKAMFTTEPSASYTPYWAAGVSKTGTFVKNAAATWDVSGADGIPSGWTVETA